MAATTPLTRERIIDTAVAIADRDGFEAVTLRRIAGELGVHVTSIYNHVPTKDAITDGIVERLIEEAALPAAPIGWEAWVRRFVEAIGEIAVAHPGAFTALERRPVQGRQATASFEVALVAFARAGLSPEDAYAAVKATTLVALSVGLEKALESGGHFAQTNVEDLPADEFPLVRAVSERAESEDAAWSFTVETLVSGLRAQLRRRRSAASTP
jgi:AcrR family transcriptional regulator